MRPHDPEVTAVGTIHVPNTRRPSVLRANINARASITKGDGAMGGFMFAGEIQPQGSVKGRHESMHACRNGSTSSAVVSTGFDTPSHMYLHITVRLCIAHANACKH